MKEILRKLVPFALAYVIMVTVAVALMTLLYTVPPSRIETKIDAADLQLDIRPEANLRLRNGKMDAMVILDKITDHAMVRMAIGDIDSIGAFQAAMKSPFYSLEIDDRPYTLYPKVKKDDGRTVVCYGRYWHGYLLWLKPMLLTMRYDKIFLVYNVVFYVFFVLLIFLMLRRRWWWQTAGLIVSLVCVKFWAVPTCMHFTTSFVTAFAASSAILMFPQLTSTRSRAALLFFIIGAFIAFAELLLMPLFTFTLPMIILGLGNERFRSCRNVLLLVVAWAAGYALMWAAKWIIATAFTDFNVIADAISSFTARIADVDEADHNAGVIKHKIAKLFPYLVGAICAAVVGIGAFVYWQRKNPALRFALWLWVVVGIQIGWYLVVYNHTVVHMFYIYRGVVSIIFALILYFGTVLANRNSSQGAQGANITN